MSNLQHSSTVSDTIYGKNVKDHDVSADNIKHKTAIENNEMDNFAITCGTTLHNTETTLGNWHQFNTFSVLRHYITIRSTEC